MLTVRGHSVSRRFGARLLFRDLDFSIQTGEVVGITGRNGSGKSTLSLMLLGQLRASAGVLEWDHDGTLASADERRRFGWLVAPYFHWYEPLTADENLRFVCEVKGERFDGRLVRTVLEQVGLGGRGDDLVRTYSSGMKQRLKLAAIFLLKPLLLVLDEPGSTLDVEGHHLIADGLKTWRESAAIILATNDPREVLLTDRQIVLGTEMAELKRDAK